MIDWHCHILPGLDDGSADLAESLEIASLLAAAGFTDIYCTPHCIHGLYDNTPPKVRLAVGDLQTAIDKEGIGLRLQVGMEYFLDEGFRRQLEDPLPLGDTGCLLVETSSQADPEQVKDQLFAIRRRGFTPLIAHPERYEFLSAPSINEKRGLFGRLKNRFSSNRADSRHAPELLRSLIDMGCRFQGNLGSFAGIYESTVKRKAADLLVADSYFCFGSDAHQPASLEKFLEQGMAHLPVDSAPFAS